MSNLPLVNVTAQINDQQGNPCAGAVIKMRLCSPDKYQGLVVPREVVGVTDVSGRCVMRVFPNALGYEGSVYHVHISFPATTAGHACGCPTTRQAQPPAPMRPIRQNVFVPNEDCNLMDILDLVPREPLPAGALLPDEVAGYAAQAADAAAAARNEAQAASSVLSQVQTQVNQAESAKEAAQAAERNAETQAKRAQSLTDSLNDTISHFQNTIVDQTEKTAQRLVADATRCIREQEAVSLAAIEKRSDEALDGITAELTQARADVLSSISEAGANAVHAVEDAGATALEDLREVAGQYEEDFLNLTERAESAAKRAGCSAAAAAREAAKACACAEDVERQIINAAVEILTPQVITEAVDCATKKAVIAADAAEKAAGEAEKFADKALVHANTAQKAGEKAQEVLDKATSLLVRMVEDAGASWTTAKDVASGGELSFPQGIGYYRGHRAVTLSWDGLVCYEGRQWEEVGETGVLSTSVRLLFAAPAGSEFEVRIAGHAELPEDEEDMTALEERLARLEADVSDLTDNVVEDAEGNESSLGEELEDLRDAVAVEGDAVKIFEETLNPSGA